MVLAKSDTMPSSMPKAKHLPILAFALAILVIVLDRWTKMLAMENFHYGEVYVINSWFELTRVHNTGAAFSLLADSGGWQR